MTTTFGCSSTWNDGPKQLGPETQLPVHLPLRKARRDLLDKAGSSRLERVVEEGAIDRAIRSSETEPRSRKESAGD